MQPPKVGRFGSEKFEQMDKVQICADSLHLFSMFISEPGGRNVHPQSVGRNEDTATVRRP